MSLPNSRVLALAFPKARATRSYQHQRQMRTERGNSLGTYAPVCVAGNDPQHNRPANRAGFNGFAPSQTRGAMSRASHCRSAAGNSSPHSRRPVLETLPGIGLHSPAERIRAARGAFLFMRVSDCRPSRAQSLAHQQTVNSLADVLHLKALSSFASFAGSQSSEVSNGRFPKSTRAFHRKKGELPNVCG